MMLLILDIDYLSRLNHHHGYSAGDEVLRQVVTVCRTQMRETDILARIESDSFALLLPEADQDGAYNVAERIRQQIALLTFSGLAAEFSCTVSIAGTLLSVDCSNLEQMLLAATDVFSLTRSTMLENVRRALGVEPVLNGSCGWFIRPVYNRRVSNASPA